MSNGACAASEGAALGYLCDEQAVKAAHSAGKGANITIDLGGRSGPEDVVPFRGTFEVKSLVMEKSGRPVLCPATVISILARWRCFKSVT
jgi:microcystin degradation protein MlrC